VVFFVALLLDGALAGALYALIALAFVVVYKASRTINFALGEWMMLATGFVAAGVHVLGLGLPAALGVACVAMIVLGLVFNRVVLRPLIGGPLISLIMVTLGLGALVRGIATIALSGIPRRVRIPIAAEPLDVYGVAVSMEKLVAAVIAVAAVVAVTWFFSGSRAGVAFRAIADDPQVAMAMGIDPHRYFALAWAMVGVIAVVAGTLWTIVAGGGFGVVLLGLKVFPIVIIGGLDSIPGTIVGALLVGVLESLAAGYLDPVLGGGFSTIAAYLVLIAMLFARPHGLFGRAVVARV
jgi:branched-chain amino acid transport system permease protein